MAVWQLAVVCRLSRRLQVQASLDAAEGEPDRLGRLIDGPDEVAIAELLVTLDPTLEWPSGTTPFHHALALGADCLAHLVCCNTWWQAVGDTAAAIDLAAAATPAQWLIHMEDRLLEAAPGDPGRYAALAWWPG
ncbi:MAG: hypothetical protein ABI564_13615 [Ideonella sp.]